MYRKKDPKWWNLGTKLKMPWQTGAIMDNECRRWMAVARDPGKPEAGDHL